MARPLPPHGAVVTTGAGRGAGRVVIVCGMPGAGKTTEARRLAEVEGAVRLCPDEWCLGLGLDPLDARLRRRLERLLWAQALELVERGLVVVVEFGSWGRVERRRMREQVRARGGVVELCLLDVALQERWRRIQRRNGEPGSVVVGRAALESFERWWQAPDAEELADYDALR